MLARKLGRLKWYAARLSAMSAPELLHRVKEQRARARLASHRGGWAEFEKVAPRLAVLPAMREALAACHAPELPERLTFLGKTYPAGQGPFNVIAGRDWLYDPVSGGFWPGADANPFSIAVRFTSANPGPQRPYGDSKFVLEPNRLQMLHPLACRIAREGLNGPAWAAAMAWIEAWMEANPPYRGMNWSSGIEIALRIVSVGLVIVAVDTGSVAPEIRSRLAGCLTAHAKWLQALPSLYSSANNHRVAEGLGLYVAGLLTGDTPLAHEGREILEREALLQILPDGVGVEQSPTYQAFTMELIAFGAAFAAAAGEPFSETTLTRLRAGVKFLSALLDSAGHAPAIGDDDEGRVFTAPGTAETHYVASVAAAVGALSGLPLPLQLAPGYIREQFFARFAAPVVHLNPPQARQVFAEGGYTVLDAIVKGRAAHLTFDHGPLGFGALAAHGHADALAIWLSVDGKPVFVDAGTYLYHSGEKTRDALRTSAAHNTLTIEGASQSIVSSPFSWSHKTSARIPECEAHGDAPEALAACGEHDGYVKRFGVRHRRRLDVSQNEIRITDRLVGRPGVSDVEISFLCAPDLDVTVLDGAASIARGSEALMRVEAPEGFSIDIVRGDEGLGRGVYSPSFGALTPTAQIVLRGKLAHDAAPASSGDDQPCSVTTQLCLLSSRPAAEAPDR
ncbi:MAG: alginate lyase family protein [Beijerinckiaceae bacterium]